MRTASFPARLAILTGIFAGSILLALVAIRPFTTASIGPDAAASVIHFDRIVAGTRLEGYLGQTPKPLLTLIYGGLFELFRDWRAIAWATAIAYALAVVLGTVLADRVAGASAAAFVAIALAGAPTLLRELVFAYAVPWALLGWLWAGLAITSTRPRYGIAGLALMVGTLARPETLVLVALAAISLVTLEVNAAVQHSARPPRNRYLILTSLLALPIMLIHDQLLTGDPLFWATIAQASSEEASNVLGPVGVGQWLAGHVATMAPLLPFAALGVAMLVRRGYTPLAIGVLGLGPGVAVFLLALAVRGTFVSTRYAAAIDLSLLFAAGVGVAGVDVPALRRRLSRRLATPRARLASAIAVGAVAALAFAPVGPLDAQIRQTLSKQIRLHANEQRASAAIRSELESKSPCAHRSTATPASAPVTVLVPPRLRAQAVVDLGLPLTRVAKLEPSGVGIAAGPGPDEIIYHDRLDDADDARFAILEIDHPTAVGSTRLVPVLADPERGLWVIRVEDASCP